MVHLCGVPGCKSNRKKETRTSTFHPPKDTKLKKQWLKAIGVKKLRSDQRICQKHFAKEDVITFTEHFDASGNAIAKIPLKYPRLKKNAIPCLFDNDENMEESNDESENLASSKISTEIIFEEILIKDENILNNYSTNKKNQNEFLNLCEKLKLIQLPCNCFFNYSLDKGIATFFEIALNQYVNGASNTIIKRSANITCDRYLSYSVLGKVITIEKINLIDSNQSISLFEILLNKFFKTNMCSGIANLKDVALVTDKIGCTDSLGILRHENCNFLNVGDNGKCKVCNNVVKIISQKKVALEKKVR